jgi:TPR repeat protein
LYSKSADGGNAAAQLQLGLAFQFGYLGVEIGRNTAVGFYRKAADGGDATSQGWLAHYYEAGGLGLEIDLAEALEWHRKAADGGYAAAQFQLGLAFEIGKSGVEIDKKMAFEWYRKAADGGYDEALPDGYDEAQPGRFEWGYLGDVLTFTRSRSDVTRGSGLMADGGDTRAQYRLGQAYEDGKPGLEIDKDQAFEFYRKAADGGNA